MILLPPKGTHNGPKFEKHGHYWFQMEQLYHIMESIDLRILKSLGLRNRNIMCTPKN